MNQERLLYTAKTLTGTSRGLLAFSAGPAGRAVLAAAHLNAAEPNRARFLDLILGTPTLDERVAGVLVGPDTLNGLASHDRHDVYPVHFERMLVGVALNHDREARLEDLPEHLEAWLKFGATFADWEMVFHEDADAEHVVEEVEEAASFAAASQLAGVVPMLTPRIHNVTPDQAKHVLTTLFAALKRQSLYHKGLLLRLPAGMGPGATTQVPEELGGIVLDADPLEREAFIERCETWAHAETTPNQPLTFCLGSGFEREIALAWGGSDQGIDEARLLCREILQIVGCALHGNISAQQPADDKISHTRSTGTRP